MSIISQPGRAPYQAGDNTRDWAEQHGRVDGKLKPNLLVRVATDTNYLRKANRHLYGTGTQKTKALMNLALPGMRVPGPIGWQVTETMDQVVQSATLELFNCIYVSTTQTTLASYLPREVHGPIIGKQYVADSTGVVREVQGNVTNQVGYYPGDNQAGLNATAYSNRDPSTLSDAHGYSYREDNVKYRVFCPTLFWVASATGFPQPAIAQDADNDIPDTTQWFTDAAGIGSYFVQIDNEIIRVVWKESTGGARFWIPPGGRGIGTAIEQHLPGAPVKLLGIGTPSGEWTGLGYLNIDDFAPQRATLRPGTALVSYEGYGERFANANGSTNLNHDVDHTKNHAFTGYWFVAGAEPSLGNDGVPRIRLDLRGPGWMLDAQKITPDLLRRAKTQFGQWLVEGRTIWGAADHNREIPGDWVDYDSWDPSLPTSYPLAIKTEIAQHQEFYDHMMETNKGFECEICRDEHKQWNNTHQNKPGNVDKENRAVGRHVYKSSIRVLQEPAGPIKTYVRLMATLAMAAWDHPAYGTELSQSFTKIPNKLFDNMRNIYTGLVFNGTIDFDASNNSDREEWFTPDYDDTQLKLANKPVLCPHESTYDKTPFYQPMVDLAEINGNSFQISREGYPIFMPKTFIQRPNGRGWKTLYGWEKATGRLAGGKDESHRLLKASGEWFQKYAASIDNYSSSIATDQIVTQVWTTGTTAFGSTITVPAAGTGVSRSGKIKMYSSLGGNTQGLALTSGVQQVETMALDNLVLGLAWNTRPAGYGLVEQRDGDGTRTLNALPELYEGQVPLPGANNSNAAKHSTWVKRVQRTINFLSIRRYITLIDGEGKPRFAVAVDGKWDSLTGEGVKQMNILVSNGSSTTYNTSTYTALDAYLKAQDHYIKFDIWWYVYNNRPWEEYLGAITGVPVKVKNAGTTRDIDDSSVAYAVDDIATQKEVGSWTKSFAKMLVNAGNKFVDDTLNKAVARSISSNFADPRIILGDIIWVDIPGMLASGNQRPFNNGIYVTNISRQMDLLQGTYTATYSGQRFIGSFQQSFDSPNTGYGFLNDENI